MVIADDHPLTRAWIRKALEAANMKVVGEAATGASVVELARRQRPDLCVLDVHMPDDGIAATAQIVSARPQTTVVILTAHCRDDDVVAALRAGAVGYLSKGLASEVLQDEVERICRAEAPLPPAPFRRLQERYAAAPRRRVRRRSHRELSPEERAVLGWLAEGRPRGEIEHDLPPGETFRGVVVRILDRIG